MTKKWPQILLFLFLLFLLGCASPFALDDGQSEGTDSLQQPEAIQVPPTFTPVSRADRLLTAVPQITVTQNPLPTQPTSTPIPFGETAVELRYTIPSIGLDRRLQGNISSQIIIADETRGEIVKRDNQAGVLIELQQVLVDLPLEPIPEGCESCVRVSYNLPFADEQGEGWLKDPVMLASIENYFSTSLGPYFPPNTVVGLRRTASPFAPAHTIAVTADGMQVVWLVTDSEVETAVPANPAILEALNQLDLTELEAQYTVSCGVTTVEQMLLVSGQTTRPIVLNCPEFALPDTLVPLYGAVDSVLAEKLAASDVTMDRPPALFPLNAVLDYQRFDGAHLTIFRDGTVAAISPGNEPITTTLASSDVISLTTTLLESNELKLGLTSFLGTGEASEESSATATPIPQRSVLLVRGPAGVYDGFWGRTANVPLLEPLNELLNSLVGAVPVEEDVEVEETAVPEEEAEETAVPEPTATPDS